MSFRDMIWDEVGKARDIDVVKVAQDASGATYSVTFSVIVNRECAEIGGHIAAKKRCTFAKAIRNAVKFGLTTFFSDDDQHHAQPPNSDHS